MVETAKANVGTRVIFTASNGGTAPELDFSFRHLLAELARIDVRIRREVRCWQLAGQDPTDAYRGLYLANAEAEVLLNRPLGTSWGQTVALEPIEAEYFSSAEAQANQAAEILVETAQQQGQTLRLEHVATTFGLDRFELDILLICLAPTFDLRYEQLYGYLQDNLNRRRPSLDLVLNLLGGPGPARLLYLSHFAEDAPLRQNHLLKLISETGPGEPPLLRQTLCLDPTLAVWLLSGVYQPAPELRTHTHLLPAEATSTDHLLAAGVQPALERAISEHAILVFHGPDGLSQEAAAKLLAAQVEKPILQVNLAEIINEELSPQQALRLVLRDARLTGAIPYLAGWEACLTGDGATPTTLLAEVCVQPGPVIVAGQKRWQTGGLERNRPLHWLEFPIPACPQRRALWEHFLRISEAMNEQKFDPPKSPLPGGTFKALPPMMGEMEGGAPSPTLNIDTENQNGPKDRGFSRNGNSTEKLDLTSLASQFTLTTRQIQDVVASAYDAASQRGGPLQNEDLFAAARAYSNPRLADLARKIAPRYSWQDLILPDDQRAILQEIVATIRERPRVLDEWGVGRKLASSAGVTVLFAGPPGTGKTMAAEVIAGELGLDLYKIDLSTLVSKYIGETEKNLERIFSEAASSNAILFFDEADAIFGKRSEVRDAHDRYANIEVSYLLQRMEAYDGVTILATNLRANLDEAFTRRLQFAVDFPFPEMADRLRIWQTLFPPETPRVSNLDFGMLARRFELAGGNIRNILVSAAYLAAADGGQVTMEHLLHGARRELQKMGRLVEITGNR